MTTPPGPGLATRADWAALADRLLRAVRPYASPGGARIVLPGAPGGYGTDLDGLEVRWWDGTATGVVLPGIEEHA